MYFFSTGAVILFLLITLFETIASFLAEERVFNAFTSSKAFYIIGCFHGLAVACLVYLVNNSVISITNTTDHTALEVCWHFVASYSLCVVLCNAVFNWSRNLLAVASTVGRQGIMRFEHELKYSFVFPFPFGEILYAKGMTSVWVH